MSDWFEAGGSGDPVDVVALLDSEAGKLLHEVIDVGALVSCGLTSDGGALGVTITCDGRWRREYFRDSESLERWLVGAIDSVRISVEHARLARASSGPRKRMRGT